jgi:hypothetical protein
LFLETTRANPTMLLRLVAEIKPLGFRERRFFATRVVLKITFYDSIIGFDEKLN